MLRQPAVEASHSHSQEKKSSIQATVTIRKYDFGISNFTFLPFRKVSDYARGANNAYHLATQYHAATDPNAFHNMIVDAFKQMQPDDFKVLEIPVLSPSFSDVKFCQRVLAIGNPVVLNELRKIARTENSSAEALDETLPRIHGGRPFSGVLTAIGMGVLSAPNTTHKAFIAEMLEVLGITIIDKKRHQLDSSAPEHNQQRNSFKQHFMDVVIDETKNLIDEIQHNLENPEFKIDFRLYALTIFLKSFYAEKQWEEEWVKQLSQAVEDVSNMAFLAIMNPYSDLEKLEKDADVILAPFIDEIMKLKQSYLSASYIAGLEEEFGHEKSVKMLREIIISLLFAGGDNIKKYLDHVMVEFGSDEIKAKYLSKNDIHRDDLNDMITEVGRLYPVIYAQPGKVLDDFVIEYQKGDYKKTIYVRKGDELHFTTFQANIDEMEWGADAKKFDPKAHKPLYRTNNATALFGGYSRRCRGQSITLSIVHYFMEEVCKRFEWTSRVDGKKNNHPTEFNFNYGVKGSVTHHFVERPELMQILSKNSHEFARERKGF
jgi:cytochrome P450